jgi:hypothetical protein
VGLTGCRGRPFSLVQPHACAVEIGPDRPRFAPGGGLGAFELDALLGKTCQLGHEPRPLQLLRAPVRCKLALGGALPIELPACACGLFARCAEPALRGVMRFLGLAIPPGTPFAPLLGLIQ